MRLHLLALFMAIVAATSSVSAQMHVSGTNSQTHRSGFLTAAQTSNGMMGFAGVTAPNGAEFTIGDFELEHLWWHEPNDEYYGRFELTPDEILLLEVPVDPEATDKRIFVHVSMIVHQNGNVFGQITILGPGSSGPGLTVTMQES